MPTRRYNAESRRRKQAELTARIAAAAAELHAAKGAISTSYADIARQAGVSLPTVHSHFPTRDALLRGCTAHVAAAAPPLPDAAILAAADLPAAAEALVAAIERQHLHFEPWLAWGEHRLLPTLAEITAAERHARTALVRRVLARHLGPGGRAEEAAAWESLLSFDLWYRLVREHRLPRANARRVLVRSLLATAEPQRVPDPAPRPRRNP